MSVRLATVLVAMALVLVVGGGILVAADGRDGPTTIVMDGSTTVGPIAKAFAEYYHGLHPNVNITVSETGSGNGAKSLINGTCDVADMSRFMEPDEFKQAVANGVIPVAHAIAMDGIAVVVNPRNPVKSLTIKQVHDIYTGQITNWSELGGPNMAIVKVSRDTSSGTYETFETLVMKKDKIASNAEYVQSNGEMRARVQSTPAAIGYVGLGFLDRTLKGLTINGVYPTKTTISTGEYPISRPLFMWTNGYPAVGSDLFRFINLYLTPKGQQIVEDTGFVPVTSY